MLIQAEKPLRKRADKRAEIVAFDMDNLYPQRMYNLTCNSSTAANAVRELSDNIECDGFKLPTIGQHENRKGQTLDEILRVMAEELARYGCAYLIVQYNALGRAIDVYPAPVKFVRIELNEDYKHDSQVRRYKVFNNWELNRDLDTDVSKAAVYGAYNPRTVQTEIAAAGGIEHYKGQIVQLKMSNDAYPLSPFHAVQSEMEAEIGNGKYISAILRRGFHACSIIEHGAFSDDMMLAEFQSEIAEMGGADSAGSFMSVVNNNMAEPFVRKIDIGSPIDANLYTAYLEPIQRKIAMAAYNMPIGLIDSSQMGFTNVSGNTINELRKMYRNKLLPIRNMISRTLAKVFDAEESTFEIDDKLNQEAL